MYKQILTAGALLALSTASTAADFDPAQHVEEQCTRCHTDDIYTREKRRAKSIKQLGRIVRRCETNLATGLFDDELEEVVTYLNDTYYKF